LVEIVIVNIMSTLFCDLISSTMKFQIEGCCMISLLSVYVCYMYIYISSLYR